MTNNLITETKRDELLLTPEEVKAIFLDNGFTVKEGNADLKHYVYKAAVSLQDALLAKVSQALQAKLLSAERYEKFRECCWSESTIVAVANPKGVLDWGADCPSRKRLDAMIDALPSPLQ